MRIFISSAILAVIAPDKAITGFKKKIPNKKVEVKHARVPSKLLVDLMNLRLPKFIPISAANVSPIDRNAIATKAISLGKKATHTIAETNK
jgi:hypothetical protein